MSLILNQYVDRLIVELFYSTGMRRSELINLKINDVDLAQETIKVLGKRNKERYHSFIEICSRNIATIFSIET